MLKTLGRLDESIAAYRKAIEIHPVLGRGMVEPRQSQDGQFRRKRCRADGGRAGGQGLDDDDRLPSRLRARQGDARCWPGRRCFRPLFRGQRASPQQHPYARKSSAARSTAASRVHRRTFAERRAAARRQIRSSSWACRAPDRPWSSKSCHPTARSRVRPSSRTFRSWRERRAIIRPAGDPNPRSSGATRRRISQADWRQRRTDAILHRQAAEQLDVRAVHPADPAKCEDHRCAAASARLLLVKLPPAFRARAGLHLRP